MPRPRSAGTFTFPPPSKELGISLSTKCLCGAVLILAAGCQRAPEESGPVIGVVQVVSSVPLDDARHGFLKALADSGFIPGKTFTLIERNAQGDIPALSLIANEFLQRGVTQVGTISSVATQAAIKIITDRPVIFGAVANPYIIGAGTTPTEHRPNVTGASATIPLDSTLALAIEAFPEIKTWGTLFDPSDPFAEFYVGMAIKAAERLGVKFVTVACTSSSDITNGVLSLQAQGAGGIMQIPSIMIGGGMPALIKSAREASVVVVSTTPGIPGAPLALGISFFENGYAMGLVMIRVLHGENPATIPFRTAVKSQMHVDLAAAKAFGVGIPAAIVARANVVLPVGGSITAAKAPAPGSKSSPWALWLATLAQGLAFIALAWGVYLSSRVLRFPDITPDGSMPLGAAVAATLILAGVHPVLATIAAFFAGMVAGYVTGLLHTRFGITELLTGILVMTGLYSINLRIMGRSNLSLLDQDTLASRLQAVVPATAGWGSDMTFAVIFLVIMLVLGLVLSWYLRTDFGMAMRAVGDNRAMITAQGVDPRRMIELGLALSNGCVAFAGALIAQYQGFADVGMGVGTLVGGMAAVILGETLKRSKWGLSATIAMVAFGAMLFRALIAIALRIGLNPIDLKLATAAFVLAALALPKLGVGKSLFGRAR